MVGRTDRGTRAAGRSCIGRRFMLGRVLGIAASSAILPVCERLERIFDTPVDMTSLFPVAVPELDTSTDAQSKHWYGYG